jgi:hypothetical protein
MEHIPSQVPNIDQTSPGAAFWIRFRGDRRLVLRAATCHRSFG